MCNFMYVYLHAHVCTHVCACIHGSQKLALGAFLQPIVFETEPLTDPEAFLFSSSGWPMSPSIPTLPPRGLQLYEPHPDFFFYIGSGDRTAAHACIISTSLNKPSLTSYAYFQRHSFVRAHTRQGNADSLTLWASSLKEFKELMNCIILWLCEELFEINRISCMVI